MATKDQERKALEQIRKIVAGLGEESYIGKAFEGCFEIASDNIDNDFWNSPKESVRTLRNNLQSERMTADTQREQVKMLKGELVEMKKRADAAENQFNMAQKTADNWCAKYNEASYIARENWNRFSEQEDKVEALELENMKLKAKLYDMMTATA